MQIEHQHTCVPKGPVNGDWEEEGAKRHEQKGMGEQACVRAKSLKANEEGKIQHSCPNRAASMARDIMDTRMDARIYTVILLS